MRHLAVASLALMALGAAAGASPGATPATARITVTAPPWVALGGRVAVAGKASPHPAGTRVTLELRHGASWVELASKTVDPAGAFTFATRPAAAGTATFRVVTLSGTAVAGASDDVPVRVLRWTYLGDIYAHPAVGDLNTDPLASAGVTYQHPVALDAGCYNAWGGDAWVDFPLGRRYEELTATVGLGDATSNTGSTGSFTIIGDSKTLASGDLLPGKGVKVSVSLDGIGRLRLKSNIPDPSGAAGCSTTYTQVVFGDIQVLGP